jgi:hypothetical protein
VEHCPAYVTYRVDWATGKVEFLVAQLEHNHFLVRTGRARHQISPGEMESIAEQTEFGVEAGMLRINLDLTVTPSALYMARRPVSSRALPRTGEAAAGLLR